VEKLDEYAVEIRYPSDWENPSLAEAQEGHAIAVKIKTVIEKKLT